MKKLVFLLNKISNNGITENVLHSEKRHLQVINLFSVTIFFVNISAAIIYMVHGGFPIYPKYFIGIIEFSPLISFFLIKYGKYELAKLSIILSINIGWYIMINNYGNTFESSWVLTNTLFTALILDMNKFWNWFMVIFLNIILVLYNFFIIRSLTGITETDAVHFFNLLTSVLLVTFATFYFKRSVDQYNQELINKQKELLETEKVKFELFFNSILECIILINKDTKEIEEVNNSFFDLFNYSIQEVGGIQISDILIGHPSIDDLNNQSNNSKSGTRFRLLGIKKSGSTFEVEVNIFTFLYKLKSHFLYIIRDISEQKNSEKLIHEKQMELIEITKKMEETKLIALRLQMNPHFIFNSLNSIQSKIALDKKEETLFYLSAFSKLIRKTMEISDKNSINLEMEIELLELYLQLESNRLGSSFSYSINIHSKDEIELYEIPPMVIQPYIENSIWHGLFHKVGDKKIDIDFFLGGNQIICVISDNGIGMEAAKKFRKNQESKGMNNTYERLRLFGLAYDRTVNVNIEDLLISGCVSGTKVTISIISKIENSNDK